MPFDAQSCSVNDALAFLQNSKVFQNVLGRFSALQRLMELLDQAGSGLHVPDISGLLPISGIDLGFYNNLRASCSYLNLPPATPGDVAALQGQVRDAYTQLLNYVNNHPWKQMGTLQGYMDDAISKAGTVNMRDYMSCIDTLCSSFNAGGAFYNKVSGISSKAVFDSTKRRYEDFMNSGGKVINDDQNEKYNRVKDVQDQLTVLLSM